MHSPRATVNIRLGIKDKPHLLCDPWWSEANHAIPGAPVKHCSGPLTRIPPTYVCLQANTSHKSTTVVQFKPSDTNVFCILPTTNSFARRNRQLQASNWSMQSPFEREREADWTSSNKGSRLFTTLSNNRKRERHKNNYSGNANIIRLSIKWKAWTHKLTNRLVSNNNIILFTGYNDLESQKHSTDFLRDFFMISIRYKIATEATINHK